MSSRPKLGVDWRRIVEALAKTLLLSHVEAPQERLIHVREPRQAEIEHWLRNRK
ncbi:hypothetical protein [Methylocystis suflitae]|uniref:hypothetical protein n=1 Tax=Methylocystis suflitae TaxID=2951405 RepID=UPI00210B7E0B|nr:hypothetical protein [Methylocystis suflitae]MCQ4189669.1 hypothetical protein [Methylocystis suflitae]